MLNKKLLAFLRQFSREEHSQLRLFLESPFFYQGMWRKPSEVVRLYDYIMQHQADEENPKLEKALVSTLFFPNRVFKEKQKGPVDSLTTDMLKLVGKFMVYKNKALDSIENELLAQLRHYRIFDNEVRFLHTEQQLRSTLQQRKIKDKYYYQICMEMEEEVMSFDAIRQPMELQRSNYNFQMALDYFCALSKVEMMAASKMRNFIYKQEPHSAPNQELAAVVLKFIQTEGAANNITLQLFAYVLELCDNFNNEIFNTFEQLLQESDKQLSVNDRIGLNTVLRNFYANQYSLSGSPEMLNKFFNLLKAHLEKGLLYYDGYLLVGNLRMLTTFALKLGHADWIKNVLENHPAEKLCGTKYPQEAVDLNWAEYYFHLKNYDKAESYLSYRTFEQQGLSIASEIILSRIYYETNNDLLDSRLKALDQKIRRSKLSKEVKLRYFNFTRLLEKLCRFRWTNNSKRITGLIEEIQKTPSVAHREWLLEKAQQQL
jgi:hypothetical protein